MTTAHGSRVTVHMAASLDGFVARRDGRVDFLETTDHHSGGASLDADVVEAFLKTVDAYVMGSRTYEVALAFEAQGLGWPYGDKPTFVLTTRALPRRRPTVEFLSGALAAVLRDRLRPKFPSIWVVGGPTVVGEFLRQGLVDEVRLSILPILIGDGLPFFRGLEDDVSLHLAATTAYTTGMIELRYEVRTRGPERRSSAPER
ncbi:MAG TPA: dihydrofolate reductase family protein [Planctomycetota bacterium]|nr:dihydrofolate reductase family protein [Planctomycetota bacterium]